MSDKIRDLKEYCEKINEREKFNNTSGLAPESFELFDNVLKIILEANEGELVLIFNTFYGYKSSKYRRGAIFNKLRTSIKKILLLQKHGISLIDISCSSLNKFNTGIKRLYNENKDEFSMNLKDADKIINDNRKSFTSEQNSAAEYEYKVNQETDIYNFVLPEEIDLKQNTKLKEGAKQNITINTYERNPKAREECINHYGCKCFICNFNFEEIYGEIGKDFIHVHHITPLSDIGEEYEVNPIDDLRPVCPNCHAMLHKRNPAYSIEEVQNFISNKLKEKLN